MFPEAVTWQASSTADRRARPAGTERGNPVRVDRVTGPFSRRAACQSAVFTSRRQFPEQVAMSGCCPEAVDSVPCPSKARTIFSNGWRAPALVARAFPLAFSDVRPCRRVQNPFCAMISKVARELRMKSARLPPNSPFRRRSRLPDRTPPKRCVPASRVTGFSESTSCREHDSLISFPSSSSAFTVPL